MSADFTFADPTQLRHFGQVTSPLRCHHGEQTQAGRRMGPFVLLLPRGHPSGLRSPGPSDRSAARYAAGARGRAVEDTMAAPRSRRDTVPVSLTFSGPRPVPARPCSTPTEHREPRPSSLPDLILLSAPQSPARPPRSGHPRASASSAHGSRHVTNARKLRPARADVRWGRSSRRRFPSSEAHAPRGAPPPRLRKVVRGLRPRRACAVGGRGRSFLPFFRIGFEG